MFVKILSEAIHHFLISPSKLDEWDYEHYFYPDNLFNISHVIKRSIQRVTPENTTCVCQLFLLCRKQFSYREQWQFWRQAFRLETIKIFSCLFIETFIPGLTSWILISGVECSLQSESGTRNQNTAAAVSFTAEYPEYNRCGRQCSASDLLRGKN